MIREFAFWFASVARRFALDTCSARLYRGRDSKEAHAREPACARPGRMPRIPCLALRFAGPEPSAPAFR